MTFVTGSRQCNRKRLVVGVNFVPFLDTSKDI